jgi:hypothetical protein
VENVKVSKREQEDDTTSTRYDLAYSLLNQRQGSAVDGSKALSDIWRLMKMRQSKEDLGKIQIPERADNSSSYTMLNPLQR